MSDPDVPEATLDDQIDDAKRLVALAEAELDAAVAALAPVQAGDKRVASASVENAFEKLRSARILVAKLARILAGKA